MARGHAGLFGGHRKKELAALRPPPIQTPSVAPTSYRPEPAAACPQGTPPALRAARLEQWLALPEEVERLRQALVELFDGAVRWRGPRIELAIEEEEN